MIPYSSLNKKNLILIRQVSDDGFYFEKGNGEEYIYYDDSKSYGRQNWTFLHEVGHCALGHTESMDPDEAEAEANFFAKYAIAPSPLVHRIHPRNSYDVEVTFNLSHEAAEYAFSYYLKWLAYGSRSYTYYEIVLLHQFMVA